MDPQTYVELSTDLQSAQFREWAGREFARSIPADYGVHGIAPTTWPGSDNTPPTDPPLDSYTLWYCDPHPKVGGGAVYKLDDAIVGFATQAQTLSDGHEYFCDLATLAVTFEQLSPEGQAAATPAPPVE
jgi:hypothetical protein